MTEFKQGGLYEDARGEKFRINKIEDGYDCNWVLGHWLRDPIDGAHECTFRFDVAEMIFRPIEEPPKKKRLMTPAECAGKWIVNEGWRSLVTDFNTAKNRFAFAGGNDYTPEQWHAQGGVIADTPTSEPYSLEVDE